MKNASAALRRLLDRPGILVMPGAHDALSAKIIEQLGFEACCMGGFAVSATLGRPDVGLTTFTEMAERAYVVANAVNIPVLADADTGYGGINNVINTVQEYERVGIAGCHIEDQTFPKKCGSMSGKTVVPAEEMIAKIKAAVDARSDKDFVIVARTDSTAVADVSEAIRRCRLFAEAGADLVMPMAPGTPEDMVRFNKAMPVPTIYIMGEMEKWVRHNRMIPNGELQELGFKVVMFATALIFSAAGAYRHTLMELKEKGTVEGALDQMMNFYDLTSLLGLEKIEERNVKYKW
jgi:2,3-dimethylmalate lyase